MDIVEEAKRAFQHLVKESSHSAPIELLVSLRHRMELAPEDEGWALWNICDRFALLRDPMRQYEYQSEFDSWLRAAFPAERLHWVVSDSTQGRNLIQGGFLEFWTDRYRYANERSPKVPENRGARFESHRGVAAEYTLISDFRQAENALNAIGDLLTEDPAWPNRDFATVTLDTLYVDFHRARGSTDEMAERLAVIGRRLDRWMDQAGIQIPAQQRPLLGTWADLNKVRPPSSIFTAINNAACAITRAKQFGHAEKWFRSMLDRGRPIITPYSRTQYLLSCWENRHDRDEIRDLMSRFDGLTLEHVREWAPALSEALST